MPLVRRRPMLRAAAVGGGAYAMGRRNAQSRQREADQEARLQELEAQQASASAPPPAAPPPAAGLSADAMSQLQQLGQLHEQGVLTDAEFAAQKARILGL